MLYHLDISSSGTSSEDLITAANELSITARSYGTTSYAAAMEAKFKRAESVLRDLASQVRQQEEGKAANFQKIKEASAAAFNSFRIKCPDGTFREPTAREIRALDPNDKQDDDHVPPTPQEQMEMDASK